MADGVACIVIHKRKVLLLKRRNLPFISNPGVWSFIFGGLERGEQPLETAYREIKEETGIGRERLKLLYALKKILILYRKKGLMWYNNFYIFRSGTGKVQLDLENSGYRWATFNEIKNGIGYNNIFNDEDFIIKKLSGCLNEPSNAEK